MKKTAICLLALGLVFGMGATVNAECTCKANEKTGSGWCTDCKHGLCYGVEVKNEDLYKALAGTKVDAKALKCEGCKAVAEKGGTCDHCKITYANGMSYGSFVSAALCCGKMTDPATIKCEACKGAAEGKSEGAYCDACKAGFVGHFAFATKTAYDAAKGAMKVLANAAKTCATCPTCAKAMVTNGTCDKCKATYLNGEKKKA
ncbi:MAG: hypothetical protein IT449_11535 [Phycisphaerales bacterium]|nr:hypothetical protein [Phycisphaerales bacterium]